MRGILAILALGLAVGACGPSVELIGDREDTDIVDDGANVIFSPPTFTSGFGTNRKSRDPESYLAFNVKSQAGVVFTMEDGIVSVPKESSDGIRLKVLLAIPPLVNASMPFLFRQQRNSPQNPFRVDFSYVTQEGRTQTTHHVSGIGLGKFTIKAKGGLLGKTTIIERRVIIDMVPDRIFMLETFSAIRNGTVLFAGELAAGVEKPKSVFWPDEEAGQRDDDFYFGAPDTMGDVDWIVVITEESTRQDGDCGPYKPLLSDPFAPGKFLSKMLRTWKLTAYDRRTKRVKAEKVFSAQGPCPENFTQHGKNLPNVLLSPDREPIRAWMKSLLE